tara:strand:- start:436 stop:939 length:504 start_codon:yes stop_codon:yes gene_type:complete
VAEEFVINSNAIETKINQLLPSQGGFAPGVDFSASTMVIPVVDLTETAEGSGLRQDLQTSISFNSITVFSVANTTTTIINTTGYYRVFGNVFFTGAGNVNFRLTDGATTKKLIGFGSVGTEFNDIFDFNAFLKAGDSMTIDSSTVLAQCIGNTRQIADISGNLVNPT